MNTTEMNIAEQSEFAADLVFEGEKTINVASDFILPDYMPDIERILRVTAKSDNESKSIAEGVINFFGEVVFTVVYVSEDNKIKSVVFSTDYEGEFNVPGLTDGDIVLADAAVFDVNAQLSNPRKILLRCKVLYAVKVYRSHRIEPEITGMRGAEDEFTLERDKTEVAAMAVRHENSGAMRGSYDLELDAAQPAVGQIVLCELDIVTQSCTAESGKLNFQGEGILRLLYETADGNYSLASQKFPVTTELALGLRGNCGCAARAKTGEITASVELNSYGEPRVIEVDYTYEIDVPVFYSSAVRLTQDIYSTEYECKPVFGSCVLRSPARNYETNFTVNAVKARTELENDAKGSMIIPVMTDADVKITDLRLDNEKNKLYAEGSAEICMLSLCRPDAKTAAVVEYDENAEIPPSTDMDQTYTSVKFTVPVKCELDAGGLNPKFGWQCRVGVSDVKGRLDSSNVYADFEVTLNIITENVGTYEYVTSATLDTSKHTAKPSASIVLYYPAPGEKLWDIAKRYGTTCRDIIAANAIEDSKLPRVLSIPFTEKRKAVFEKVV